MSYTELFALNKSEFFYIDRHDGINFDIYENNRSSEVLEPVNIVGYKN